MLESGNIIILTPKLVLESASRRGFRRTVTEDGHNARGILVNLFSEKALDGF